MMQCEVCGNPTHADVFSSVVVWTCHGCGSRTSLPRSTYDREAVTFFECRELVTGR